MPSLAEAHPSAAQLAAFSLGRLDDSAAHGVANHLAGCSSCRHLAENTPPDTFVQLLRTVYSLAQIPGPNQGPPAPLSQDGSISLPEQFGRYRILGQLGQGGMGTVFLAHDTQLDRRLALKVPRLRSQAAVVLERFYREARAAAAFDHPNLCPVFDVGCIAGIHYLTMPFIEGTSLADLILPGQLLPPRQAALLVRKLALALHEAHRRGVVHRDLKPSNIMMKQGQEPVIMDFGLARLGGGPASQLTDPGTLLGTPAYMSPEQVLGDQAAIGPACDIYALGVILYQMLTGRLPFEGPVTAILGCILTEEPLPVSQLRPEVGPILEGICRKAMAKQIADRYASMADLAAALTKYLQPAPPTASWEKPANAPDPSPSSATAGKARRPTWMWLVGGAAAFFLLLLGIVLLLPTPKGTIKIELNDPKAQVELTIDKEVYTLSALGKPLRLRVGEHDLVVTGENFETITRKFTVRQGDNPLYQVELLPRKVAAAPKNKVEPPMDMAQITALVDKLGGKIRQDFSLAAKPLLEVNLLRAQVTDNDLRALANQAHLQVLILGDTRISDAGLVHLKGLTNLQRLDLGTTDITDAGLVHLKGMTKLTRLELFRTTIGDAGLAHLGELHELRVLGLEGTRVGDAGLAHLNGLTKLEALNLSGTNVSDEGLEHLKRLIHIREFHVQGTLVSEAGKKRIHGIWAQARAGGGE